MKKTIFTAFALLMSLFYTDVTQARGCVSTTSGSGIDGNVFEYKLVSPIVVIDPDAPVGSILWIRHLNTQGIKWLCDSGAQRPYSSSMTPAFSQVVGTNIRGNIYASGIEGLGIQISDMMLPSRAVASSSFVNGNMAYIGDNKNGTRIDFIKVGPIGEGELRNGKIATFVMDGITVMEISMFGSRLKYKSCTIDGSYNRTIPLGSFKATEIADTSPNVPFEFKLKCQADAIPVYVQFDALNGSSGSGLLKLDDTVESPASGVVVEVLNGNDMTPLKFGKETKYHTSQETSISIPLIARYKKTGPITPGQANAGMTITISER